METKFSKFENILKYDKSCDISNKELLISIKNEMNKSVQVALLLDNSITITSLKMDFNFNSN